MSCIGKKVSLMQEVDSYMVKLAEDFYQRNPANAFGITKDTYIYLLGLIDEYDKIQ